MKVDLTVDEIKWIDCAIYVAQIESQVPESNECEEIRNLLEKLGLIEKKVEEKNGQAYCPSCKKLLGPIVLPPLLNENHCNRCGQKLDWSDYRNEECR